MNPPFLIRCTVVLVAIGLLTAASNSAAVTLVVENDSYYAGETVRFTLTNDEEFAISMPSSPVFAIRHVASGAIVFPGLTLPVVITAEPGESEVMEYDTGSNPDVPGLYEVFVKYYTEPGYVGPFFVSDTYILEEPVANGHQSWGALKSRHR